MQLPLPAQPEDLPNWGQIVVYIGVAAGSAIAVVIARLGLISGRRSGSSPDIELAGALISNKKADEIIDVIKKQTEAMLEEAASNKAMVAASGMLTIAVDKNTASLERAAGDLGEARQEVRELTREIVRMGRT